MEKIVLIAAILAVMCYTGYRFTMAHHKPVKTRTLLLIIFVFLLQGCLTVNRIQKNCDKFATVCITDEVTEIVYRDTTIFITDTIAVILPPDTVTITDTVHIDRYGLAWLPDIYKEFGLVWVRAGVKASILNVSAGLTDSTFLQPRIDTVTINNAIKEETTTSTAILPPERFIPKFYKFTFWFFMVAIMAGALFILSKVYAAKLAALIRKLKP